MCWQREDGVINPPWNSIKAPWFSSAIENCPPLPFLSSCTPLYHVATKWNLGCTPLIWSHQYFSVDPSYRTHLPPKSGSSEPIWDYAPLCGCNMHKRRCCVSLLPNPTHDVPRDPHILPTEPTSPLNPPQCWKSPGRPSIPASHLSLYWTAPQRIYRPSEPPPVHPSTAVVTSVD